MKGFIALAAALFLGLAGCSAATAPAWQTKAGSIAYQTQDSGQSQSLVPPSWYDNDPAMSQWYTPPYFTNENPG